MISFIVIGGGGGGGNLASSAFVSWKILEQAGMCNHSIVDLTKDY